MKNYLTNQILELWTPSSAPGANGGVSKIMHVITFLPADFPPIPIISILAPVAVSRGVGNVVRSFVLLTSIQRPVKKHRMQRRRIQQPVVKRK
jgi:hypothetical protein